MSVAAPVHADLEVEQAVLGAFMLYGEPQHVLSALTRGLRPAQMYWRHHGAIMTAIVSLAERQGAVDTLTVKAELDRLGLRDKVDGEQIAALAGCVPAAGHLSEYIDRVIELARWRQRQRASHEMQRAVDSRDAAKWAQATADMESATAGTRTDSYSPEQWASLLFDYFSTDPKEIAKQRIPGPFEAMNRALGGGLGPGEVMALGGITSHGKSVLCDQWLDTAARHGKRCHLYMTEMTALNRGMRYLARRTGVPYMRQRDPARLTDRDRKLILEELRQLKYGCSIAADWDVDDIVRHAHRGRFDLVVIDLIHGFHYSDERDLDRLSKAMQKLARVSTTIDGHAGTAVIAVVHVKREPMKDGTFARPTIASIKGASSIEQDADVICFVWQEQRQGGIPIGNAEAWLAKGRTSELTSLQLVLNPARFRFDLRATEEQQALAAASSAAAPF